MRIPGRQVTEGSVSWCCMLPEDVLETASHLLRTLQKLKVRVRDVRSKVRECQVRQKSHNVRSDKVDNEWILNVIERVQDNLVLSLHHSHFH